MNKIFEKKWLVLSCLALVLVVAIVIGICVGVGNGEKDPNPTEGTSNVGATDPTETTGGNGNEVTDPSDNTDDPSDATEPTGTPENPAKPSDPQKPDDYVEPSEPDATIPEPTTPDVDPDDKPAVDPDIEGDDDENIEDLETPPSTNPTEPDVDEDIFGGVTGETIRYSDWASWDAKTRQAFYDKYLFADDITPEVRHNVLKATRFADYECGVERHICTSELSHKLLMEAIDEGCKYCGKHDCESFFVLNPKTLYCDMDPTQCPEYDVHKDPTIYCQDCGEIIGADGCIQYLSATNCYTCGEWVESKTCHHCEKD